MSKRVKGTIAAICATALLAGGAGTAFAVGGPNEAGNSGKFHPKSNPCQGANDHPNCSGPK